jgi:tripartite ATP-independent transporter DctM subunit
MNLSPVEIGCLMILLLFVLMYLKMPVGASMLVAGLLGFILIRGVSAGLASLGIITWRQGLKDVLLLIPTFTWMGLLASYGGISGQAFSSIYKWVGHLPGGLAMATTGACAAFGAVCGNQFATALTMSAVALPEMRKYKYDDAFSLATIASSGNLGIMIPPSGSFVLYGFLTETSIGALFIAGILPGLVLTLMFWIQMYLQCRLNPALGPQGPRFGWIERIKSIKGLWAIALVFLMVMGGIYTGVFTPGEAAACGVAAVFIIAIISRKLSWNDFVGSLRETLQITAMIMLIIIGAMYFGAFMAVAQIPNVLVDFITSLAINRWAIIGLILLVYVVCGFVMDVYSVLVITLPILFPVVQALGFDSLHFGVLCILTIMMGGITPPFGGLVFVLAGMFREVTVGAIFRRCWPFVLTMLIALVILLFVPAISTLLPDLMIPYR